jgi:osmotically-inducible protein OsmY
MKMAAQDAAQRVEGVRAVANELSVRGPLTYNDTDIAKAVVDALDANFSVPPGGIDVTVQNGKVKLTGEVDWAFQRAAAADSVRSLRGVRDLDNLIVVKQPRVSPIEVQSGIERALLRAAALDADHIHVATDDGHVTLSGTVRSLAEKREAALGAWRAKGVTQVTNNIDVRPI